MKYEYPLESFQYCMITIIFEYVYEFMNMMMIGESLQLIWVSYNNQHFRIVSTYGHTEAIDQLEKGGNQMIKL